MERHRINTSPLRRVWNPKFGSYLDSIPGLIRWPCQEAPGATVARGRYQDSYNSSYDADIITATVAQPADGNLNYSYLYDGTNDYLQLPHTALNAVWDGTEGSWLSFVDISTGVWIDGVARFIMSLYADANNRMYIAKNTPNNRVDWVYIAGGTSETISNMSMTTLDFFSVGLSWSKTNDQVIAYLNGYRTGAIATGIGTWAGDLIANNSVIGALSAVPAAVWSGHITENILSTRVLSATEFAEIHQRSGI